MHMTRACTDAVKLFVANNFYFDCFEFKFIFIFFLFFFLNNVVNSGWQSAERLRGSRRAHQGPRHSAAWYESQLFHTYAHAHNAKST